MTHIQLPTPPTGRQPSSLYRLTPTGAASFVAAVTGVGLLIIGNPYWLSLVASLAAVASGVYVIRRARDDDVTAHIGATVGILNLLLWLVIDVLLGVLGGVEFSILPH